MNEPILEYLNLALNYMRNYYPNQDITDPLMQAYTHLYVVSTMEKWSTPERDR